MGVSESVSMKAMRVIFSIAGRLDLPYCRKFPAFLRKIARSIEITPIALKALNRIEL